MAKDKESGRFIKSPAQGAATTVYAAVRKEWEGSGGRYLADCIEQAAAKPETPALDMVDLGYARWAFDQEKAARLWEISCELVGIRDDDK